MIAPALSRLIEAHAIECYPREACGLVIDGTVVERYIDGTYVPVENIHAHPEAAFHIDPQALIKYEGRITAYVHSHPNGPDAPSEHDMITQERIGLPSIIVSTDGINCTEPFEFGECLPPHPLEGRSFRHAVTDCFEAIRDWYTVTVPEKNIKIASCPRDWGWWKDGKDYYRDNFRDAGFRLLEEGEEQQYGDAFFVSVGSPVPNHGGIYLGNAMIYHHLGSTRHGPYSPSHLSVVEFGLRWQSYRPTFVRHRNFEQ